MEMNMHEITERDLFNALAPYHPMRAFQNFIVANKEVDDIKELKKEIAQLTKQRNHLKSEIAKLQKNRLTWLQEEVKEREKLGLVRKKVNNAEIAQQLEDFRAHNNFTYKKLEELTGVPQNSLYSFVTKPPRMSKHLPAIKRFLQNYHLDNS